MSKFNDANYQAINAARWQALDSARLFDTWRDVTVLDLGAGDGVFSDTYFTPKHAIVTPVEARQENLHAMNLARYEFYKRSVHMDLELDFPTGQYDMVLCVGLLYHLQTPTSFLMQVASAAPLLFLETVIWQNPDETGVLFVDEDNSFDQAYSGKGCRVGIEWLDKTLKALYPFVYAVPASEHPSFNGRNVNEQRVIRVASHGVQYKHLERV